MRTSYLPQNLVVVIVLSFPAMLTSVGCTSRTTYQTSLPLDQKYRDRSVVNLNTAERRELEALPQIGPALAEKIIEHRTLYGPFRKREHILILEGVSDKRFEQLKEFIDVE